jgi:hypothetical protein
MTQGATMSKQAYAARCASVRYACRYGPISVTRALAVLRDITTEQTKRAYLDAMVADGLVQVADGLVRWLEPYAPLHKTTNEPPTKRYKDMNDDEVRERLASVAEITDECEIVDTGLQVLVPIEGEDDYD